MVGWTKRVGDTPIGSAIMPKRCQVLIYCNTFRSLYIKNVMLFIHGCLDKTRGWHPQRECHHAQTLWNPDIMLHRLEYIETSQLQLHRRFKMFPKVEFSNLNFQSQVQCKYFQKLCFQNLKSDSKYVQKLTFQNLNFDLNWFQMNWFQMLRCKYLNFDSKWVGKLEFENLKFN